MLFILLCVRTLAAFSAHPHPALLQHWTLTIWSRDVVQGPSSVPLCMSKTSLLQKPHPFKLDERKPTTQQPLPSVATQWHQVKVPHCVTSVCALRLLMIHLSSAQLSVFSLVAMSCECLGWKISCGCAASCALHEFAHTPCLHRLPCWCCMLPCQADFMVCH